MIGRKNKIVTLLSALTLTAVLIGGFAVSALATTDSTEETATASVGLAAVSMYENTSYVTDKYFGVIHLIVDDDSIVTASLDSQNHVVVSGISSGSTTIRFWYKATSSDGWTSATLPVTVRGGTSAAASGSNTGTANVGICFSQSNLGVQINGTAQMTGITENGQATAASKLLWVSSNPNVATVESATGLIKGVAYGTATVYALDPVTKSCNGFTVQVTS